MTAETSTRVDAPRLTVCRWQALRQIQAQMAAGCELRDVPIDRAEVLAAARLACAQWLHDNRALLLASFDQPCIATQYDATFGGQSETSPTSAKSRSDFVHGMNVALTGLWSLMQRLEFLAEAHAGQRGRWLASGLIRQPITHWPANYYYLPS